MVITKEIGMKRFIAVMSCFVLCGSAFAQVFDAPAPKKKSAPAPMQSASPSQAVQQTNRVFVPVLPPPSKATMGFFEAAKIRNVDVMEIYLAQGADVNCRNCDGEGWTPLLWQTWAGNIDMIKYLLARGADVNAQSKKGLTPLIWLQLNYYSYENYAAIVNLLFNSGVRIDLTDADGRTVMDFLPPQRVQDVGELAIILRKLLDANADINHKDPLTGSTLIMRLADTCASEKNLSLVLRAKPDLALTNNDGQRAVDIALERATKRGGNCNNTLKVLSNPDPYISPSFLNRVQSATEPEPNGQPPSLLKLTSGLLNSLSEAVGKK
jgi:ankyrin repeat protein